MVHKINWTDEPYFYTYSKGKKVPLNFSGNLLLKLLLYLLQTFS